MKLPVAPFAPKGIVAYLCPRCNVAADLYDHGATQELRCPKCQTTLSRSWPVDKDGFPDWNRTAP